MAGFASFVLFLLGLAVVLVFLSDVFGDKGVGIEVNDVRLVCARAVRQ